MVAITSKGKETYHDVRWRQGYSGQEGFGDHLIVPYIICSIQQIKSNNGWKPETLMEDLAKLYEKPSAS